MANLFYPQLSTGALAQYPISKKRQVRTIRNVMRDGSVVSLPDSGASTLSWTLEYTGLSQADVSALKALFDACAGPYQPFTFLDPTGNALIWSSDLTNSAWQKSPQIAVVGNVMDPNGGVDAFDLTNNGQGFSDFAQAIAIPSNYQYCFSLWVLTQQNASLTLLRRGLDAENQTVVDVDAGWTKVWSSGRLEDGGNLMTVGLRLAPGQSVSVFGPQLEPQTQSSPYRPTANLSAVLPQCFWAADELVIRADAPGSYSTLINLETAV